MRKFLVSFLIPVSVLGISLFSSFFLYESYEEQRVLKRAEQVARNELSRAIAMFNFKLNSLREEAYELYAEQAHFAQAFSLRPHLQAIGVFSLKKKKWELSKSYFRDPKLNLTTELQKAIDPAINKTYFFSKLSDESFIVAFPIGDPKQASTVVTTVFHISKLFSFCKFLGTLNSSTSLMLLSDNGKVLCHSQAQYEGKDFQSYSSFKATAQALGKDEFITKYTGVSGEDVTAAIREVEGVYIVSEAAHTKPIYIPIRPSDKGIAFAILFFLIIVLFASSLVSFIEEKNRLLKYRRAHEELVLGLNSKNDPRSDSLGIELSEYTKLRSELKETEKSLLEMQEQQADLVAFKSDVYFSNAQTGFSKENLKQVLKNFLKERWDFSITWIETEEEGKFLKSENHYAIYAPNDVEQKSPLAVLIFGEMTELMREKFEKKREVFFHILTWTGFILALSDQMRQVVKSA